MTTFKWNNFVEWAFLGLLSWFAYSINMNISDMQKTISELNKQVAIVISDNAGSKELLKDHEFRLRDLERKR